MTWCVSPPILFSVSHWLPQNSYGMSWVHRLTRSLPDTFTLLFGLDMTLAVESQAVGVLGFRRCLRPKVCISLPNLSGPWNLLSGLNFTKKTRSSPLLFLEIVSTKLGMASSFAESAGAFGLMSYRFWILWASGSFIEKSRTGIFEIAILKPWCQLSPLGIKFSCQVTLWKCPLILSDCVTSLDLNSFHFSRLWNGFITPKSHGHMRAVFFF